MVVMIFLFIFLSMYNKPLAFGLSNQCRDYFVYSTASRVNMCQCRETRSNIVYVSFHQNMKNIKPFIVKLLISVKQNTRNGRTSTTKVATNKFFGYSTVELMKWTKQRHPLIFNIITKVLIFNSGSSYAWKSRYKKFQFCFFFLICE